MKKLTTGRRAVQRGFINSPNQEPELDGKARARPDSFIRRIKELCVLLMGILVALMSLMAISYLESFRDTGLRFEADSSYEVTALLAHAIVVVGFILLSFGTVQAFRAIRSFSTVYSEAELLQQLHEQQAQTREALANLEATNARLRQQAATDWLTGVANRRHFIWHANREIARATREGTPLSLLCLDLDYFKNVNDTHGHQAGDEVLKHVAATLEKYLRPSDLLARTGGEEFQVLLPGAVAEEAREIAERCRSAIHYLRVRFRNKVLNVTVSIGCAQLGQDGSDMDSLIHAGDQRLYEAKEHGRDQVAIGLVLQPTLRAED
jgi:diguanylate cyclase (GGDEF)-like protein